MADVLQWPPTRARRPIEEGDRVGVPWLHTAWGHCEHCITGWETLCDEQQMTGHTVNGGFTQIAPILCAGIGTDAS